MTSCIIASREATNSSRIATRGLRSPIGATAASTVVAFSKPSGSTASLGALVAFLDRLAETPYVVMGGTMSACRSVRAVINKADQGDLEVQLCIEPQPDAAEGREVQFTRARGIIDLGQRDGHAS